MERLLQPFILGHISLGFKICQVRITPAIWWAVGGILPASCGENSEAKMCYVSVYALVTESQNRQCRKSQIIEVGCVEKPICVFLCSDCCIVTVECTKNHSVFVS